MPEHPVQLSAAALRLVGHVGQTVLDRMADADAAAMARLDQHTAAVRAHLTACRPPVLASAQRAGLAAGCTYAAQRTSGASAARPSYFAAAEPTVAPIDTAAVCPDVPFVDSALAADAVLPVRLLLHYACGFIEAAVISDWWPSESARHGSDWESMRLAAICRLISQAEAAAELHPDLRALA
jgi:Family of unknown function (DUF6401)